MRAIQRESKRDIPWERYIKKERERKRERETETERNRTRERQTKNQIDRYIDRET